MKKLLFLLMIIAFFLPVSAFARDYCLDSYRAYYLIKYADSPSVYYLRDCAMYKIPTQDIYEGYFGSNYSKIITVNPEELAAVSYYGDQISKPGDTSLAGKPINAITSWDRLVKGPESASVYLIKDYSRSHDRLVFPMQNIYEYYYGKNSFYRLENWRAEEVASKILTGNVTLPPHALVKIETSPKIYDIIANGYIEDSPKAYIRWLNNPQEAARFYGIDWYKKVITIPDSLWNDYIELPYLYCERTNSSPSGNITTGQELEIIRFKMILYNDTELQIPGITGAFFDNLPDEEYNKNPRKLDKCVLYYSFDEKQWVTYAENSFTNHLSSYTGTTYYFENNAFKINPRQEIYFSWKCLAPNNFKGLSAHATMDFGCNYPFPPHCVTTKAFSNYLYFK